MKKRNIAVFLLAALILTIVAGCRSANDAAPIHEEPLLPASYVLTPTREATEVNFISAPHAENIARNHAGVTENDVIMERTELDHDDGLVHYDVGFRLGHYEYDYEIDAGTGEILSWERNYDAKKVPKDIPVATEPASEDRITAQQAEAIALNHAGLTAEDVVFDYTEVDHDHGVTKYEVEFSQGRWEYSYEIDAVTGQILEWEKDYDD